MTFITRHKHRVLRKWSPLKWMFQKLFAEDRYNSSLEIISDLPKGEAIWWFDHTDRRSGLYPVVFTADHRAKQ